MKKLLIIGLVLVAGLMFAPLCWAPGPSISVTKICEDASGPRELIYFSGQVTAGPRALENVTVTDDHAGLVLGPITLLNPGESVSYSGSYIPTTSPSTNTVRAEGTYDTLTVWDEASATCGEVVVGECRMTGGNATVSPVIGEDGLETWTYDFKALGSDFYITTGGQIGAPSGGEPRGHWTHTQHGGAEGNFTFHSGTSSAPDGTEISTIECADPGWCVQARCAPFKQIFWTGVGNFASLHFDAVFYPGTVVPFGGKNKVGTLHFYRAMVGDFGENDRPTREESLVDSDSESCNWFDLLPSGPPGPYVASSAISLASEPDDQFGDKGGQICDKCPDYYQIEIHETDDPGSDVIYEFYGYLESGNYQIHPKTGEQCPAIVELVPELFEQSKGKGRNK